MTKGYENVKNSRHRLKRRLLYVMGEKCCICNYNKCASALEFHHLNPEEKDFTIASNTNTAFEKAIKEVKKCILVCANCHREIHEGLITDNLENYQSFNEEKYKEISKEIGHLKKRILTYCKDCGKIISKNAERCPECNSIVKRKVERPSREELKELIKTTPFTTIAKQYGVSDNAVRKWCIKEGLPCKKAEIQALSEQDWIKL